MAKYIAEVFAFALILAFLYRYVAPHILTAMHKQQESIRAQFEDARTAKERAEAAEAEFNSSVDDADTEREQLLDSARSQAEHILADFRTKAEQEAENIAERGRQQLTAERDALVRELRREAGAQVAALAGRIASEALADDARRSATVERFLSDMKQRASADDVAVSS